MNSPSHAESLLEKDVFKVVMVRLSLNLQVHSHFISSNILPAREFL